MKQGLLPLSQDAILLGQISYHDFNGVLVDEKEIESIGRDMGPTNKVMFLRNHGVVACGSTIEQAWTTMVNIVTACEMQVSIRLIILLYSFICSYWDWLLDLNI